MQQSTTSFNTTSDFECFQNYTSPEIFVQQLAGVVNQGDISSIIKSQKQMYVRLCFLIIIINFNFSIKSLRLQRFEKTNEMLTNCNALSQTRLKNVTEDYKKNCKLLMDMKKDLDYIYRKIRTIKGKLETKYPTAFDQVCKQVQTHPIEEDEEVATGIDYEQLESLKLVDPALEARDSSDSTS